MACDRDYLVELREYLAGFLHRTKPLLDVEAQLSKARETFAADWEAGSVPGWADRGSTQVTAEAAAGKLDVDAFDTVEELETIGAFLLITHAKDYPPATPTLSSSCQGCPKMMKELGNRHTYALNAQNRIWIGILDRSSWRPQTWALYAQTQG